MLGMNNMNLNIVPSRFTAMTFSKCTYDQVEDMPDGQKQKTGDVKLDKPIEVLFEGADTNIYKPTKEFSKDLVDELKGIEEDFCFLFVGHWLQGGLGNDRKDLGMLIKTFLNLLSP